MDLYDNPASANITATFELPGVKSVDMMLSIKDGCLIVQGERRDPMVHCGAASERSPSVESDGMEVDQGRIPIRTCVQELRFGRFHRSIPLPAGVEVSHAPFSRLSFPR